MRFRACGAAHRFAVRRAPEGRTLRRITEFRVQRSETRRLRAAKDLPVSRCRFPEGILTTRFAPMHKFRRPISLRLRLGFLGRHVSLTLRMTRVFLPGKIPGSLSAPAALRIALRCGGRPKGAPTARRVVFPFSQNSKLNSQNSKLKTQDSKLKTQNSKLKTKNSILNSQFSILKTKS